MRQFKLLHFIYSHFPNTIRQNILFLFLFNLPFSKLYLFLYLGVKANTLFRTTRQFSVYFAILIIFTYLLIYLLTPCSRVLLEKLTGLQLVKKFSFYGTRRFITAFTSDRQLSLSWASSIQSIPPHPTSWRSILMLSSHLRLYLNYAIAYMVCSWVYISLTSDCTKVFVRRRLTWEAFFV